MNEKAAGIECETDQFGDNVHEKKGGNKISETLRSKLSEGSREDCGRGLGWYGSKESVGPGMDP